MITIKPSDLPHFVLPKITKPPIFEQKQQLINFFKQDGIAELRPLGKIVGIEIPMKVEKIEEPVEEKKENAFWKTVGYKASFEQPQQEES